MGCESFFLDPYGEILPCNVMQRSMGNLQQQSFAEIWHGQEAEAIRQCVDTCPHNCWMIGSAAEPIKKRLSMPLKWIVRRKILQHGRTG
jgi:radical SAM protein with 4Fe4S-binding SPASM domain